MNPIFYLFFSSFSLYEKKCFFPAECFKFPHWRKTADLFWLFIFTIGLLSWHFLSIQRLRGSEILVILHPAPGVIMKDIQTTGIDDLDTPPHVRKINSNGLPYWSSSVPLQCAQPEDMYSHGRPSTMCIQCAYFFLHFQGLNRTSQSRSRLCAC